MHAQNLLDAALASWTFRPGLVLGLLLLAACYARGWSLLRRSHPTRWSAGRLAAFLAGLALLAVALQSPIDTFAGLLLSVHMIQHWLLVMVIPPLLWFGRPGPALIRGLPRTIQRQWIAPVAGNRVLRRLMDRLTRLWVAWLLFVLVVWAWHHPAAYQWAIRSERAHFLEHTMFLSAGLLFWYPLFHREGHSGPERSWLLIAYLLLADVQNTIFSAILCFSRSVLYPHYEQIGGLGTFTPMVDQAVAGAIMWVPGSIAFLIPIPFLVRDALRGPRTSRAAIIPTARDSDRRTTPAGSRSDRAWDLLHLPLVGRFLEWKHARPVAQGILLTVAILIVFDGLFGPSPAPMNLAGVLPWTYWRGLSVLALAVLGNWFCFACPFLLPRQIARWLAPAQRTWPRWLRTKWLAVGLIAIYLAVYETLALWDRPAATAAVILLYFATAFVIDRTFRGANFCKYLCPIGQFHFVQSTLSPFEVRIRDADTCQACPSKDCIRGNSTARGCELGLFQPRKEGNMDCTFCLDCVHACPKDNVGILVTLPGRTLVQDRSRSGVGRWSRRLDIVGLMMVLTFGAFANAAGMTEPVLAWQDQLARTIGAETRVPVVLGYLGLTVILVPLLLVGTAGAVSLFLARPRENHPLKSGEGLLAWSGRHAVALVPLGAAMWLAHFAFHLWTSLGTVWPAAIRFANDRGWSNCEPDWSQSLGKMAHGHTLLQAELFVLGLGLVASVLVAWSMAWNRSHAIGRAMGEAGPWILLACLLHLAGAAILSAPMELRGTLEVPR